jgi:hypothetical protein
MYRIGQQGYGQTYNSTAFSTTSKPFFKWEIKYYHKSSGLKKQWFIGQDDCPITSLEFELNLKLCGAGSIMFAFLDFPIDGGDYIEMFYDTELKYRALVENTADIKGGKVKLIPYSVKFQKLLMNNAFVSKTISEILQTIIEANDNETEILWNAAYIDTGETDTYTISYAKYENVKKVIDELVGRLDNRQWGVRPDNYFTVYEIQDTTYDNLLVFGDKPYFSSISIDQDFSKIKATRYQVFKKTDGAGEITRIGEVGYGGAYPVLTDIENEIGEKREDKFTASPVLSDAEALDFAYLNLISQTRSPKTIKGNDGDLSVYFPAIGDYNYFQDRIELILLTIINCDTATGWSAGVSLDTGLSVEGTGSIEFDYADLTTQYIYDFGEVKRYNNPEKLVFMVQADVAGSYLELSTGIHKTAAVLGACSEGACSASTMSDSYLFEESREVYIPTSGNWVLNSHEVISSDFQFIAFRFKSIPPGGSATVNIDRIQLYTYDRQEDSGNVVKALFKLTRDSENYSLEAGQYDLQANSDLFEIEKNIKKLEAVQNAS